MAAGDAPLAWRLRVVAESPGWRRELRAARRWLTLFLAGCPLSFLLFVWAWANRRVLPVWTNMATLCAFGVAGLGLFMFYLRTARAVSELGGLLRSPGLTAAADQTATYQRLVPPFWLCAYGAVRLLHRPAGSMGPMGFFLGGWVIGIIVIMALLATVAGPFLYWIVSYIWLMRQAASEVARAPTTPPYEPQQGSPAQGMED